MPHGCGTNKSLLLNKTRAQHAARLRHFVKREIMAYIMFNAPEELQNKLARIVGSMAKLGVEANYDEVLSYIFEEGADIVFTEVEQKINTRRFLDSFNEDGQ